jgi:hypothetical protein
MFSPKSIIELQEAGIVIPPCTHPLQLPRIKKPANRADSAVVQSFLETVLPSLPEPLQVSQLM